MEKQRRHRRSSASDVHIPHEIVVQVLVKLPSRSLMRFRCVCKLWKSTISDPQFALSHRTLSPARLDGNLFVTFWRHHRNKNRNKIIVSCTNIDQGKQPSNASPIVLDCKQDGYHDPSFVHVSDPLDGLVCVYSEISNHALVLNITTGEIMHLPRSIPPYRKGPNRKAKQFVSKHIMGRGLARGLYKTFYALGFDSTATEYKVLNLYSHARHKNVIGEIYTLGTTSRRRIDVPPPCVANHDNHPSSAYINGTIYWLKFEGYNSYEGYNNLIAFDVGKEVFRIVGRMQSTVWIRFFAIGERLAILVPSEYYYYKFSLLFLEKKCGDNSCRSNNNGDLEMETVAFEPMLKNAYGLRASGIRPTTGEIIMTDHNHAMTRIVYLDLEKRTCREEHFKWPHPNGDESSSLQKSYNYVENILRLTDDRNSNIPDPDDNFLIEAS